MAKSKKVVSKKASAPAQDIPHGLAAVSGPVVTLTDSHAPLAPVEAHTAMPSSKRGRKAKAEAPAPVEVDPAAEARAKWTRRLKRWQAKAEAQGVDARALMEAALSA
jgi:hypothetical protein